MNQVTQTELKKGTPQSLNDAIDRALEGSVGEVRARLQDNLEEYLRNKFSVAYLQASQAESPEAERIVRNLFELILNKGGMP